MVELEVIWEPLQQIQRALDTWFADICTYKDRIFRIRGLICLDVHKIPRAGEWLAQ